MNHTRNTRAELREQMYETATTLAVPFKEYLIFNEGETSHVEETSHWYENENGWSVLFTYDFSPLYKVYVSATEGEAELGCPWTIQIAHILDGKKQFGEFIQNISDERLVIELARIIELIKCIESIEPSKRSPIPETIIQPTGESK